KIEGYEPNSETVRGWLAEGREEGLQQGREEGLRIAIRQVCAAFGVTWSSEPDAPTAGVDAAALDGLLQPPALARRWPDGGAARGTRSRARRPSRCPRACSRSRRGSSRRGPRERRAARRRTRRRSIARSRRRAR